MIDTSYKNAPTCVSLSTFKTDLQLHPGSAMLGGEERLLAAVASSSQATWAGYRLDHERVTAVHITEIRSVNLALPSTLSALSCGRMPSSLHQECPGAGLNDGCTNR